MGCGSSRGLTNFELPDNTDNLPCTFDVGVAHGKAMADSVALRKEVIGEA